MKKVMRNLFFLFVAGMLLAVMGETGSEAKKIRIVPVKKGQTKTIYTVKRKKGKTALKKLTAKTSNKSVASVKVAKAKGGKKYCVKVTGKKTGSVMVIVKVKRKLASGKVKTSTVKYKINVISIGKEDSESDWDWNPDEFNSSRTRNPSPSVPESPSATRAPYEESTVKNYTYSIEILNRNYYNNNYIYVYIKTDFPDGAGLDVSLDGNNHVVHTGKWDDVHYAGENGKIAGIFNKCVGGYIGAVKWTEPGHHILTLYEVLHRTDGTDGKRGEILASVELELEDDDFLFKEFSQEVIAWAEEERKECDELVKNILDTKPGQYEDGVVCWELEETKVEMLGEALHNAYDYLTGSSSMIFYQSLQEYLELPNEVKLARMIGAYIYKNYHYTFYTEGERRVNLLSEGLDSPWWTPGKGLDCWDATGLLNKLLLQAGIEGGYGSGNSQGNSMHRYGVIEINGVQYKIDAQPRFQTGFITDWDYII